MKRILFAIIMLCIGISAQAQHSLQIDNGTDITIITGAPGGGTYQIPAGGGTLLTTASPSALPNQSGQGGKFLTTDGSTPSWATVSGTTHYFGGHTSSVAVASVNYAPLSGIQAAAGASQEKNVTVTMPFAGTVTGLYVTLETAPDNGASTQYYEIRVSNMTQATTSAAVTISETAKTGSSTGLSLSFNAGDQLSVRFEPLKSGGSNPSNPDQVSYGVIVTTP